MNAERNLGLKVTVYGATAGHDASTGEIGGNKILVETDTAKRDQMIKQAYEISIKDYAYIPLHQQALSWGVSKKVKLTQRADNQVLLYWATKQEE